MNTKNAIQPVIGQTALALGIGRSKNLVAVEDYAAASAAYMALRDASGLGGSEWPDGRIYCTGGDKPRQIAYVSYNGKVWSGTRYAPNATPIHNPYATVLA